MIGVDDALGGVKNLPDAEMEIGDFAQIQDIHDHETGFGAVGVEEAVA